MTLRFAVLFNEVISALSGSFVLVEDSMTSVFHSIFRGTIIPGQCLFDFLIMESATEQIAEPFKPCHHTTRTNILHCVNKMQLSFS